jgi:ethanolamine utilization protein EutQ (cupin superfamily)
MSEQKPGEVLDAKYHVFRFSDIKPSFTPRGSSTHEQVGARNGTSIAGGVVFFKDAEIPFTLWYDELLICHAVEESFHIVVDNQPRQLAPGDMIWLPAGTSLIYRSKGTATAFWAVTPPDWADRRPAS